MFCFSGALWSYAYFLWQIADNYDAALFWSRALMVGAIISPIAFFHLVLTFLELDNKKFYKIVLGIFYLFTAIWLGCVFTPYYVSGVNQISYFKFWPTAGVFYGPFLISFYFLYFYSTWLLIRHIKNTNIESKKSQILIMVVSVIFVFVGGSTNFPLWYGINIPPWGNPLISVFVALTTYSIIKYKFLNAKVLSTELFTGLIFVLFLIDVFLSRGTTELMFRILALVVMVIFGFVLIRSVRHEVKRREEVTTLAHSLEKANLRLQELDRQKTEFLSIASHQLRTPLSILKGYIELIKDGGFGKPTKGIVKVLGDMDDNNEHLIKLVDEFLNISRIEQGRTKFVFEKENICKIIEGAKNELELKAKDRGVELEFARAKKGKDVVMDSEKIRHVIFNFIDNAIKYSDKGKIKILVEDEDGETTVRVRDQGFGFDKVDEANFFQKFYRGENVKGTNVNGTGLGLYVCRKFIEAHGGKVWAHSPGLGKGSEFGFWLPAKPSN